MDISNSAMIALYPDQDTKSRIVRNYPAADYNPDDLHLTICYLGEFEENPTWISDALNGYQFDVPVVGTATALTTFGDADEQVPVLLIDSLQLVDLYVDVRCQLGEIGVVNASEHGFIPHVTIDSEDSPVEWNFSGRFPVRFDRIAFVYGNQPVVLWSDIRADIARIYNRIHDVAQELRTITGYN